MRHTLYTKEFFTRQILGISALGIDLHADAIAYTALKKSGRALVLGSHGRIPLPDSTYEGGVIRDKMKLIGALKRIRTHSRMRYVRASIPEEHVYVIDMTVPKTEKKKVLDRIKTKLAEILPVFFNDILINYEILSEDQESFHLNVAIAKKPFVDEYLDALKTAGFSVVSLEFRSAAIADAIVGKNDTIPKLIVSLEQNKLSVFAITDGFIMAGYVSMINADRDFHLIKEKIDRAYIEWQSVERGRQIDTVILTGVRANEYGLADYLSIGLKMRVEIANVWTNVNSFDAYIPEITQEESLGYAGAIGLALVDFEK